MGLKFSEDGPEFPVELVDALLNGKAIFLCGAGVSAPQLPGFAGLVDRVYAKIGAAKKPAEADAIKAGRFEEALGALSRRLSNRTEMLKTVHSLLAVEEPNLENHKILLRLSRNLDNRPALVTTNFDTFFERAIEDIEGKGKGKQYSLAGQALPPPGSDDFSGIIHLHGRLADKDVDLEATPLVLTSAEYGEAYMRSGWASRFLFDLVRCRTLVLIGYSAGDAPIRYFLNILEADRERFSDIQKVYALDAVEADGIQALDRWEALAVQPLAYRRGRTSAAEKHGALWRDLGRLADLVDTPKAWRKALAAEILVEAFETRSPTDLSTINWIFTGKRDVWDVAITAIHDPKWFDYFTSQKLMTDADAGWVLAAWCALEWTERSRLDAAVTWHKRFGRSFGEALENRLGSKSPAHPLYFKAWSLLTRATRPPADHDMQAYRVGPRVRGPHRTDADLRAGVRLLRPRIDLRQRNGRRTDDVADDVAPARLNDLFFIRMTVDDRGGLPEIGRSLRMVPDCADRLVQIATQELRITIELAREAELIGVGWDALDAGVPTVEAHTQNEHRDGAVFLAVLLTDLLPTVAAISTAVARACAETWRELPSQLGVRLWLHALRQQILYTADEVAKAVLELPKENFWSIRRELILAMAERLAEADHNLVARLCDRILADALTLYEDLGPFGDGKNDWRPQVRDRDVWLRLDALRRAGVLPDKGSAELKAISVRHPFIAGDFEDKDLFGSYTTGVRFVSGDATPLKQAKPEDRLPIAHKLSSDWDLNTQRNWSAYCSVDPTGALDALKRGGLAEDDAPLWNDLIGTLAWSPQLESEATKAQRGAVVQDIFTHLGAAGDAFLQRVCGHLVDLWPVACSVYPEAANDWWDRLWAIIELDNEALDLEGGDRFYDRAINQPAGRLAEHLISAIDHRKTRSNRISPGDRARLRRLMSSTTKAGWLARGICCRDAGFILFLDRSGALKSLRPWMAADDVQGATLRSVLVEFGQLGASATRVYRKELKRGVLESQVTGDIAAHVASRLLVPLLSQAMSKTRVNWGLQEEEVREILKRSSPSILEGAAHCFRVWVTPNDMAPEIAWRLGVQPVFEKVWPREREFKRAVHTANLAGMCVSAGKEFPDAFDAVRHYLVPYVDDWVTLYFLDSSKVPELYPIKTLELLWAICGPGCNGQSTDLGKILDRIGAASRDLVLDRRYQWLEQRATRYD
jgi:hypothetical protein